MVEAAGSLEFIAFAADIVSAFVTKNALPAGEVAALISDVHSALRRIGSKVSEPPAEAPRPAVSPRRSVTNDFLVCLEDGRKFKSLKRHLRTHYNLSPEDYREKWGLPSDYPMVAPSYAKARSELAKQSGLGQQRRRRP